MQIREPFVLSPLACVALAMVVLLNCSDPLKVDVVGQGGSGGEGGAGGTPPPVEQDHLICKNAVIPPDTSWRKLTARQFFNSIEDLLLWSTDGDTTRAVMSEIGDARSRYPADSPEFINAQSGYHRQNQVLAQRHIDQGLEVALAVARQLQKPEAPDRMRALLGECATAANTEGAVELCIKQFVSRFAMRAFRQPVSGADVDMLAAIHPRSDKVNPVHVGRIVAVILASPEFLYRIEHGSTPHAKQADTFALSPFELAARLSYQFWDTLPDDELWAAATDGSLTRPEVWFAQVNRMLHHERARATLDAFWHDYLNLDSVPDPTEHVHRPQFRLFAGNNLPTQSLRGSIVAEALDMARHSVYEGESLDVLATAGRSFARTNELAALYGAPVWDGQSPPPTLNNRPGIFTHAWFMLSGMVHSHLIFRGVKMRLRFLCDEMPPPQPGAADTPVDINLQTERRAIEMITQQEGSSCRACHVPFINQIGFNLGAYDGLGRHRTHEMLFNGDLPAGSAPVDTNAVPQIVFDDLRPVDGAEELMQRIVESEKLEMCLGRNLYGFTFARTEIANQGNGNPTCAVDALGRLSRHSLLETIGATAQLGEFHFRSFAELGSQP